MNILILDTDNCGLAVALRFQADGHKVLHYMLDDKIGKGMVDKVKSWKPKMAWADLIFVTDSAKLYKELEPYFKSGYPIFGPNKAGAELELDRELGQDVFAEHGIEVLPYQTFKDYDDAIAYVKKEGKPFVSKPWGGNPDKDLSYVPKSPEDLICRLERWKREGVKGEFLLQEMVTGAEMAVGGWFGPGGWSKWINENWEEKRMMAGGLGPNTGEMGTVMRYTAKSKLFDDVLEPVTPYLEEIGYVGYVDVNCLVDDKGVPWPLEFTCRPGWPHFNLCMALHQGDLGQWMRDVLDKKDTLKVSTDVCVGVVMAMGDYPWDNMEPSEVDGWPIRGLDKKIEPHIALSSARMGEAVGPSLEPEEMIVTAGSYVLIATGTGSSVCDARDEVYGICDEINWPPHRTFRIDIGCRMEEDLPKLQKHGYAKGMKYE